MKIGEPIPRNPATPESPLPTLPCPWCGNVGINVVEGSTFRWIVPECATCGATPGEIRKGADPIAAWNDRAPLAALEARPVQAGWDDAFRKLRSLFISTLAEIVRAPTVERIGGRVLREDDGEYLRRDPLMTLVVRAKDACYAITPTPPTASGSEGVEHSMEAQKALGFVYDHFCAMDNGDIPLEAYPQKAVDSLAGAGWAVVPCALPFAVLGEAGMMLETGNPKFMWDFLIAKTRIYPRCAPDASIAAAYMAAEPGRVDEALIRAAEEIERGHEWITAVAASVIIRKHAAALATPSPRKEGA